jgi:pimaricinolide synthase PimS2
MSGSIEEYRSRLRDALGIINDLKSRVQTLERARIEPIAIVGIGCRFPGGGNGPEAFWRALRSGVDAVREVSPARWSAGAIPGERPEVRWAALLDDIEGFDAAFFGISPREAASLDPQQRLLLEVGWEALEDGGHRPEVLMGRRAGVFVGLAILDYQQRVVSAGMEAVDAYSFTGNLGSTAAGRLSYVLGLQGPCVTIDTACSSSLIAVHLACQSLRNGECELALAGGVNAIVSPFTMAMLAQTNALSPDGRCKSFDARANGYVRGEGCGLLLLKRLSDALRDGDRIHALIRGSATNQDGRSTGLTTPNVLSQQALLRQALEVARVKPEAIAYVETHGTGTPLGDPIEFDALKAVLGHVRPDGSPCVLGALKTNVGHLEGAAGVAGIIKAVLALEHEEIPRNLHFRTLNPRIELDDTPFLIPTENVPFRRGDKPRLVGVSSFGISGTNAHVILEEAPHQEVAKVTEASAYMLPLSARSDDALSSLAEAYEQMLASGEDARLHDIVYTASVRRTHHERRVAVVGGARGELCALLQGYARGEVSGSVARGTVSPRGAPRVVFVFSGQGSQWAGMGQELLAEEPVFRAKLEECAALFERHVAWSLLDELRAPEARSRMAETEIAQPALFALQVALSALLLSWGIVPEKVLGHSVGEVAAAQVAGILSLDEACRLVAWRGRIMQRATGSGKMVSVAVPEVEATRLIAGYEDRIAIAAVNDPGSVVLSGDVASLDAVLGTLGERGVEYRPLRVNYAFHSPQMEPLAAELVEELGPVDTRPLTIPMYSTVTGGKVDSADLRGAYWGKNVRATVRFADAVRAALDDGHDLLLEVGPHPVLALNLAQCIGEQRSDARALSTLRRGGQERRTLLEALGRLYAYGCDVNFARLFPEGGRCVSLPAYPWQRERHWLEGVPGSSLDPPDRHGEAQDSLDELVFSAKWLPGEPLVEHTSGGGKGAWVVLVDEAGLGTTIVSLLRGRGEPCVEVTVGEHYEQLSPSHYRIDPAHPGDYRRLLLGAFGTGRSCRGILHLWSLLSMPAQGTTAEVIAAALRRGAQAASHLAQTLQEVGWRDKPRLWIATRGAQAVTPEDRDVDPLQAPSWGIGRALALEYPELRCTRIDLEPGAGPDEAEALVRELLADHREEEIGLRGGHRHVGRLVGGGIGRSGAPALLRADASYVIVEGPSGIGMAMARWLVARGARHVGIVIEPGLAGVEVTTDALRTAGVNIVVAEADVADAGALAAALTSLEARLPRIAGAVYAVGAPDEDGVGAAVSRWMAGVWNFEVESRRMTLDMFMLCASAAGLFGVPGFVGDAAATAFAEALTQQRRQRGLPAQCIAWGAFEEGCSEREAARAALLAQRGLRGLDARHGAALLDRLVGADVAFAGAVPLDARQWVELFPQVAASSRLSPIVQRARAARRAPLVGAATFLTAIREALPAERQQLVERLVRDQVAAILRADPARVERLTPLRALGLDSIMGLELRNRLEAGFGQSLPATVVFSHPTVTALAAHLYERVSASLQPQAALTQASTPILEGGGTAPVPDDDLLAAIDQVIGRLRRRKKR